MLTRPPSPASSQLPPAEDFDGKAINMAHPPLPITPSWDHPPLIADHDGNDLRACWRPLWADRLPHGAQIRYAISPFTDVWCQQWFQKLQTAVAWDRPRRADGTRLNRHTAWFVEGTCTCAYKYSGLEIQPRSYPQWLLAIMEVIMPQCGLSDSDQWPTCCNLNYYASPLDSVGPHADDEPLFEGKHRDITIISLSLGGSRRFCVYKSHREQIAGIQLNSGDLVAMELRTQSLIKHGIDKLPASTTEEPQRINLTWRWLSAHRTGCPAHLGRITRSPPQLPLDSPPQDLLADSDALCASYKA